MSVAPPVVNLSHICFSPDKKVVLDQLALQVPSGHFMAIIGPNGAGKSTLLTIMAGLLKPHSGHIDLFGKCLTSRSRRKLQRDIGYLHQTHGRSSDLPMLAKDVVAMGLVDYNRPLWFNVWRKFFTQQDNDEKNIQQALDLVEMSEFSHADFRVLSGGQQQRIRLARALVRQPKLLLLDEPSAALDSRRQEKLYQLLRRLCDEKDMTVIMVEHDVAAITSYVDSVACLNKHIHHHAKRGETIPDEVWTAMYGDHVNIVAHDSSCIGCAPAPVLSGEHHHG